MYGQNVHWTKVSVYLENVFGTSSCSFWNSKMQLLLQQDAAFGTARCSFFEYFLIYFLLYSNSDLFFSDGGMGEMKPFFRTLRISCSLHYKMRTLRKI
jgi:hypothetical protein